LIALLGAVFLLFSLMRLPLFSGVSWGLLALACSFAGLRGFWVWLLIKPHWLSIIIAVFIYGGWLIKKAFVYKHNNYYPSGIDGKIEMVKYFTWRQLISPLYFNWTYSYYGKKELRFDFKNWHKKIGGIFGLYQTNNRKINYVVNCLTILMGLGVVRGMLSGSVNLVILTLILLYPSLLKRFLPRNSIMAIPLLGYFLAKGVCNG
jgi:hypothetical protein